ncbi:DUF6573 family protein [Candidatus Neomarinimicrobiota bacterium]
MKVIHSYSADQAIADGFLIPTTDLVPEEDLARQAGFLWPIRITSGVLSLVEVPKELESTQDLKGRLWDLLFMSSMAFRREKARAEVEGRTIKDLVPLTVLFQMNLPCGPFEYELYIAPDYTSGPALHIFRPDEY